MALSTFSVNAFNAGKQSELLISRVDVESRARACIVLKNGVPTPQGPVKKLLGKRFSSPVKYKDRITRGIEFIFSDDDSFIIELGHLYMRFHTQRSPVFNVAKNVAGITKANPAVVTITAHGYNNGDTVYISGVAGMTQVNGRYFRIANKTTDTFELEGVNSSAYGTYTSGGTGKTIYEIASPYTEDQVRKVKYAQQGDIAYLAHPSHFPQKLSRFAADNWTLANVVNVGGPFLDRDEDETITLTASATTGSTTITASAALFTTNHVGSLWELRDGSGTFSTRAFFRITAFTDSTHVTATIIGTAFGTSASTWWAEASWSGEQGYPRAVAFHEQRLFWGGTNEQPLTVFGSASNERFEIYDEAEADAADAFQVTLTGRTNTIQWMLSDSQFLVCGTGGGLAFVGSGKNDAAFTPENAKSSNGTSFSSSDIQGLQFNNTVKYMQKSRTKLLQAQYDDISLSYTAEDLTVFSDEIIQERVIQMTIQEEPYTMLWCVKEDGTAAVVQQEVGQQVVGWFDVEAADPGDLFQSVAIIPGQKYDEVWFVVKRLVGDSYDQYLEYIEPDRDLTFYVDSGVEYDGTVNQTLTLSAATVGTSRTFTAGGAAFAATDVGRKIYGKNGGRATITAYTSSTIVTCEITTAFPATSVASGGWRLTQNFIGGMWHLEGREVDVVGDNAYAGRHTVLNGQVSTENDIHYGLMYAGLPYVTDIEPMPPEPGGDRQDPGSSQSRKKKVNEVSLLLRNSGSIKMGPTFDNLNTVPIRTVQMAQDTAPVYFGATRPEYVNEPFNGDWDQYARVCIRSDLPLPLTLLSLHLKVDVSSK